jgi:hypothetical protein
MTEALPVRCCVIAMLAAMLLAGCQTTSRAGRQVLAELTTLLPGSYDNLAQSRLSGDERAASILMIAPVDAPLVGDHVYYVQESAADDPRRVFAQRLYTVVESGEPLHPALMQYDFAEPARWRDGQLRRELFRSLLPQDLRVRAGCDLRAERVATGFKLANDPARCRVAARGTGETLRAEQQMELDREGIALLDVRRDGNGAPVEGAQSDPWYRFVRRADAPW